MLSLVSFTDLAILGVVTGNQMKCTVNLSKLENVDVSGF